MIKKKQNKKKFKNHAFSLSEEDKSWENEWDKGSTEGLNEAILIEWELPKVKEEKDKVSGGEEKQVQVQLVHEL